MDSGKQVLSVTEAAKILGISRNLAYASVMRGEIPSFKVGKRILVPRIAFEKMLQDPKVLNPSQQPNR